MLAVWPVLLPQACKGRLTGPALRTREADRGVVRIGGQGAPAAPAPVREPSVMWARFQGFRAGGKGVVKSGPPRANACIASYPNRMPPAALSRAVVVASSVGTLSIYTFEPAVVLTPAVSYRSFSAMGMPCSGPL